VPARYLSPGKLYKCFWAVKRKIYPVLLSLFCFLILQCLPNTNQLKQVLDEVGYSGNYAADIDNQTETENYIYDAIGNLVQDKSENLTVAWTVYGKIKSVTKVGGTIYYTYDAAGNRISKTYDGKTTVYVRDASGNVMSIYEKDGVGALVQAELHLYGSSRLGLSGTQTIAPETGISLATGYDPAKLITFTRGEKIFELSNHLGNSLSRHRRDAGYHQ